ncbi:amidohydrolase family protein [Alphaproteobacteria bacterium]|jgi:predicted TIM-barrel fold metal-dependent hydrolase|nr:amidohydrolase family protein [Alphaproteobacteria bacterium]MDC0394564.1 amidohydrolase family protein [Alphaproteobacteria bacterium]
MDLDKFELFDSHFHIIDSQFPLFENNGFLPEYFSMDSYFNRLSDYTLIGGAVVSGSFQGFDQSYLVSALQKLGSSYAGVTQLPADTPDNAIIDLDKKGIKAVRFNLFRGGSAGIESIQEFASRIFDLCGWHVELYLDSANIADLYSTILSLPSVSIDHLGLTNSGHNWLLKLMEKNVRVKATGFGRINFDARDCLKDMYSANPNSLMFATDLPSTRASKLYSDDDFHMIIDILGEDAASNVFSKNALKFYKKQNIC